MRIQQITRTAALFAVLLAPSAAAGQVAVLTAEERGRARAEDLRMRAEALYEHPERYAEAALLMRQAARVRPAGDGAAVEDLIQSGRLYAYAGDASAARSSLVEAATRALDNGDLVTSAHALIDAAFVAIGQRHWRAVEQLTARAERLVTSPHVDRQQRAAVLRRIDPAKVAIANAGH